MRSPLILFLLTIPALAQDVPKVAPLSLAPAVTLRPAAYNSNPGSPVLLSGPDGATWEAVGTEGKINATGGLCVVSCDQKAVITVICKVGMTATAYTVVFDGDAPVPPTPPVPDELTKKLADAFATDGKPKAAAKLLASIYTAAAGESRNVANDLPADVLASVRVLADKPDLKDKLMAVRKLINNELAAILVDPKKPFTAATREATAKLFDKAAAALEELAK